MKYCPLLVAIGMIVPGVLRSAEPTNQIPSSVSVETNQNAQSNEPNPAAGPGVVVSRRIVYKLPLRGSPAVRIDGGSRGSGISLIRLMVLAPDQTGLTVQGQPSLFWYQSEPANVPFILTVLVDKQAKPVLRVKLPEAKRAGIQRLRLSDYHVTLTPGVEYEWVVALMVDPESRSKDVVASGYIQRVEPPAEVAAHLANSSKTELPNVYAEEGIWYDALSALSDLIEAQPGSASLRAERADLLEQVGITNVVADASSVVHGD